MPPGVPVATVGINAAQNAAILASQVLGLSDDKIAKKLAKYKDDLKEKISKANDDLLKVKYDFKVNPKK
jgi:5-(carboxyamino)imidazole ribonucleotide mutase